MIYLLILSKKELIYNNKLHKVFLFFEKLYKFIYMYVYISFFFFGIYII